MKHLILLITFLLSCYNIEAQGLYSPVKTTCFVESKPILEATDVENSFALLKGVDKINFSYYFADAKYKKAPIIEVRDEFDKLTIDKTETELNEEFAEKFNDRLEKYKNTPYISNSNPAKYTLKLYVTNVERNGNHSLIAMLIENTDCKVVYQRQYNACGGKFGTLVNLLGDAARNVAKQMADDVKKACK